VIFSWESSFIGCDESILSRCHMGVIGKELLLNLTGSSRSYPGFSWSYRVTILGAYPSNLSTTSSVHRSGFRVLGFHGARIRRLPFDYGPRARQLGFWDKFPVGFKI